MNKIAQEKARSAVEFLSSVDPDVLREIHPETRERLLTKLTEAFPRKAYPSRIEATHPAIVAAALAPFEMETEEERTALAAAMMSGPPIPGHVVTEELLQRAMGEVERLQTERDSALTQLDVANEVIGEVRGVCKAGNDELTVMAVRRAVRLSDAAERFYKSMLPVERAAKPTAEEVAAWGREFEASAVRLPRRKAPPPEVPDTPLGEPVGD